MNRIASHRRHSILPFVLAVVFVAAAGAHDYDRGGLHVGHPWARPTPPGVLMAAAYLSIANNGTKEDVLTGAHTVAAARVELHQTSVSGGMARMRPLEQIVIAPGRTVRIEPGGIHLMLVDLGAPFVEGTSVPLTLEFRDAGPIDVELKIESRDAPPAAEDAPRP